MLDLAGTLRSIAINTLIHEVADVFEREHGAILDGRFDEALVGHIASRAGARADHEEERRRLLPARDVLKLELTGSVAIQAVLDALIDAALPGIRARAAPPRAAARRVPRRRSLHARACGSRTSSRA